jgi:16S rRNA (cytosine967-C5)-methyltransferase
MAPRVRGALAGELREAAELVSHVAAGRSLSGAAPRSALLDLTHGTLRRYGRMQALVRELSRRARPDALLEALLWCALYALESGRYAEYTVVDQSVRACGLLERWSAKGYVNAVLRKYLRERSSLESRIAADPQARYQHPAWWIDLVQAGYPDAWESILQGGNSHPPMSLRVNPRRGTVPAYESRLAAAGIASHRLSGEALLLPRPVPVQLLPGFAQGDVSVQDVGAQRAARCLELETGLRVLDACAAPGGKAGHILETADVELTALDADAERLKRAERNLERLQQRATLIAADCTRLEQWWDGKPFDRVLADLPCSASGVARRHPDLKWLRRAGDVATFAAQQGAILDALWQVLRPGGKLLYVTCSVFPPENEEVVQAFVARAPGARSLPLPDADPAQLLPSAQHDGFFYALIQKRP